ncbi:type IX secretion system membrane protein PorP/SprF [Mucilaginibacter terrenus]|uniref:Type IX secretion system membrane protein PorP/SprF n=1 Tax=Mucilaginibacter terrenus TaxID=2482727 RepID=A0A3E2NTN8_9SPHI|nr:PorP/SprF family type IX secretion system membrane protein [Mucilaginibacter terrenus]RFZ84281.1 type IX secretion system membrane protein PorP/SprF [Mucilaginibacter terrenus]
MKFKIPGMPKACFVILAVLCLGGNVAKSQSVLQAAFFQNQYITNPAMAGLTQGLNLNLGLQQQFNSVPGSPKMQNFTADYNSGGNVGTGLNVNNDQAGLISRTRIMATYAYHLRLGKNDKLNFGLSLGLNNVFIDYNRIIGDPGDGSVDKFNRRSVYVDGDLGVAYTSSQFTIQGAVPNLRSIFLKNDQELDALRNTFFTAVSYKLLLNNNNNFTLEPKVAYRGIKGFDNILDTGANLNMAEYNFSISGMYHSNKSGTIGVGINLKPVDVLLAYTNNTSSLNSYANNTFEIGLKLNLLNKE